MSKATVVTATSTSPAPMPGSWPIEARKFTRPEFRTSTPLGRPVDPEV